MGPESAASRGQSWQHLRQPSRNPQLPVPAALGDKAQFTRKRSAAETPDDDMAAAMRAAVKKARGIHLSGAPGALARHGSQIHEGMTNGPFGSDPRLDRGVAGWPTGVTGHEAHHRRHDQQGYFCQAKQCMSGDGVFTIACRLQSGGLLGHQATTTKPVNGPPDTSRTSGRPPSGMRCQTGLSLVCDCPLDQICEADILIGLYFDATSPVSDPRHRGTDGKWSRTFALLQGIQALPNP